MRQLTRREHQILILAVATCACFLAPKLLQAQGTIRILPHLETSLENHHNDTWPVFDPVDLPITEMSLFLDLNPMNQINPNGEKTVFRTDSLSPVDTRNDSHFLLDPSQFTILQQGESTAFMSATIRFHTPSLLPRANSLVQVVARDGHTASDGSFATFRATVTTTEGFTIPLSNSVSIIPEPSSLELLLTSSFVFAVVGLWRRK